METSIIVSGFGGQGVLFAGQVLAYTGMDHGKKVTWIPSYGPEMRGGTAGCTVIISDEEIGGPIVARPSIVLAMNLPSFEKYEPLVQPGGLLVVNSSIVDIRSERTDIEVVYVAANAIATEMGSVKMMNMAILGALVGKRPLFPLADMFESLEAHLPKSKHHLLEANYKVMQAGFDGAKE